MIKTLAIETSCDDTSIGIVTFDGNRFESTDLVAYSQISDHQKFGGVVPEVASRLHSEKIIKIFENIGYNKIKDADFISVTAQPGLPGSLLVGINAAHMLGNFLDKKVVEVNHILGHIFSIFLERSFDEIKFPLVILTASGGHNEVYLILDNLIGHDTNDFERIGGGDILDKYPIGPFYIKKLGQTLDDAVGECFDKVARMLGGPYPGGLWVSQNASNGKPNELVKFDRIFLKKDEYNFSFSGMKSKVYYLLKQLEEKNIELDQALINDICFEFQESVVEVLGKKLVKAAKNYGAKSIAISGGVSANDRLFEFANEYKNKYFDSDFHIYRPMKKVYSTDNGAMMGVIGIIAF